MTTGSVVGVSQNHGINMRSAGSMFVNMVILGPKQGRLNPFVLWSQAPECDFKWVIYPADDVAATLTATAAATGPRSTPEFKRVMMECAGVGGRVGGEFMNTSGTNNWFRLSGGLEAWTRWEWAWLRL
jgi:hypothetical protein